MTKSFRSALLGALALALIIPAVGMAQTSDSATAEATATIVTPISISKVADLAFGDIVADALNAGSVTVAPGGGVTPSIVQHLGGHSAASFTVTGEAGKNFGVTIPNINLSGTGGVDMLASFTPSCNPCTIGTALNVGGTLTVNAGQGAGDYSGEFTVTVSYQ